MSRRNRYRSRRRKRRSRRNRRPRRAGRDLCADCRKNAWRKKAAVSQPLWDGMVEWMKGFCEVVADEVTASTPIANVDRYIDRPHPSTGMEVWVGEMEESALIQMEIDWGSVPTIVVMFANVGDRGGTQETLMRDESIGTIFDSPQDLAANLAQVYANHYR